MNGIAHKAPLLLALAAALAMIAVTGLQAYEFWQNEMARNPADDIGQAGDGAVDGLPEPRSELTSVPLFGTPGQQTSVVTQQDRQSSEDLARLMLRGALAASGRAPGTALIETEDAGTEAYSEGDRLPGGALLRRVFPSRIIVEQNGTLTNIYLTQGPTVADASENTTPTDSPAVTSQAAAPPLADTGARREEIQRRLEALQQRLRSNE